MALTTDDIVVRVTVDQTGAIKGFKDLDGNILKISTSAVQAGNQTSMSLDKLDAATRAAVESTQHLVSAMEEESKSGLDVANSLIAVNQAIELGSKAYGFLKDNVYDAIKAFKLSEDNVTRLGLTLSTLGEKDVNSSVDHFKKLGDELSLTTTATRAQVLQLAGLSKQIGLTDDQTDKLVKTSVDLAAAQQEDVTAAFDQLTQSLKGNSRVLGVMDHDLVGVSKDWLQAGGAIDYFAEKLNGRGSKELQTFGGQLKQNEKVLDEFKKAVGEGILLGIGIDPDAPSIIAKLASYIDDTKLAVAASVGAMKSFIIIVKDVFKVAFDVITSFVGGVIRVFQDMIATVASGLDAFKGAAKSLLSGDLKGAAEDFSKTFEVSTQNTTKFAEYMGKSFDATMIEMTDNIFNTGSALGNLTDATKSFNDEARKMPKKPPLGIDENAAKEAAKLLDELGKRIRELGQEAAKIGANEYDLVRQKANAETRDLNVLVEKLRAQGALTDAAKEQLQVARDLIKAGVEAGIQEINEKKLGAAKDANFALDLKILEAMGETQKAADLQLASQLDTLQSQIDELETQGEITDEIRQQLELEQQKLELLGERQKFEKELSKLSPEAQSVGEGLAEGIPQISKALTEAGKLFGVQIGEISESTAMKIALVAAKVFDAAQTVFESLFTVAATIFDPDVINGLADALDGIQKWPQELLSAFSKLGTIIDQVIKSLPAAIQKLLSQIPSLVSKILDALPELIDTLLKAFDQLINSLPGIFQRIFDKLPALIAQLLKALPGIIKDLFSAIGDILASLLNSLPDILNEIFEHLPDIIESIIEGLMNAIGKIVAALVDSIFNGGLEKMVASLLRMIPRLIVSIIEGVIKGLMDNIKSLLNGVQIKIPGGDIGKNLTDGLKKVVDMASGVTEQVFKVIDISAAGKAKSVGDDIRAAAQSATDELRTVSEGLWARLKELWQWVSDHIMMPIINALRAVWTDFVKPIMDMIVTAFMALWNGVIKPIADAFVQGLEAVWGVVKSLWTDVIMPIADAFVRGLGAAWDALTNAGANLLAGLSNAWKGLTDIWTNIVKPVVDGLVDFVKSYLGLLGQIGSNIGQALLSYFNEIKTFWTDIFHGKIKEAFQSIIDFFTSLPDTLGKGIGDKISGLTSAFASLGNAIGDALKSYVSGIAGVFSNAGTSIWNGLKGAIDLNFFSNLGSQIANGITSALGGGSGGGGVAGSIGKAVSGLHFGGGGMVTAAQHAASGLYVMAPQGIDQVPIMAATDEGILNRRATANLGGKPAIDALNAGGMISRQAPQAPAQNITQNYSINVKVDGNKAIDETDLANKIIKSIRDQSYAGRQIISTRGLRSS